MSACTSMRRPRSKRRSEPSSAESEPSLATVLQIVDFPVIGGSLTVSAGIIQLPEVQTTTIKTSVQVPDGGTVLIGGQKLSGEIEIDAGVPILSKIPVLKRAFSNRTIVKDEQTLLILVQPKIIIQEEAEEEAPAAAKSKAKNSEFFEIVIP